MSPASRDKSGDVRHGKQGGEQRQDLQGNMVHHFIDDLLCHRRFCPARSFAHAGSHIFLKVADHAKGIPRQDLLQGH